MVKKSKYLSVILAIILFFNICIIPTQAENRKVIIGGEPFGLKLYCKGVMVIKLEQFESSGQNVCPAKDAGIKLNDIIKESDEIKINSNEQLSEIIKKSKGKALTLKIRRGDKTLTKKLTAKKDKRGMYYSGMWIRDSCAGLGTISYYDTKNMTYGALGHGICDIDTGGLMPNGGGEIISANITSTTKSENNDIGTLNGYFTDNKIGSLKSNTNCGVFGKLSAKPYNKIAYEIADIGDIKPGDAVMYSTVKGEQPNKYTVKILGIINNDTDSNRNLIIRITDKKLLQQTGGIVQGMSGSPIVQENKFVGALTHVFIDDCKTGYAVLATNMINK